MSATSRLVVRMSPELRDALKADAEANGRTSAGSARWHLQRALGVGGSTATEGQVPAVEPRPDPPKGTKPPAQKRPTAMTADCPHDWRKERGSSGLRYEVCKSCGAKR